MSAGRVTYLIGRAEIIRVQEGNLTSVGRVSGPTTNARLILADLTGVAMPGEEVVAAFAERLAYMRTTAVDEVTEDAIDRWAAEFGLTLGKRGVRGL